MKVRETIECVPGDVAVLTNADKDASSPSGELCCETPDRPIVIDIVTVFAFHCFLALPPSGEPVANATTGSSLGIYSEVSNQTRSNSRERDDRNSAFKRVSHPSRAEVRADVANRHEMRRFEVVATVSLRQQRMDNSKRWRPHPTIRPAPLLNFGSVGTKNQSRFVPPPGLLNTKFEHRLDQLLAALKTAANKKSR